MNMKLQYKNNPRPLCPVMSKCGGAIIDDLHSIPLTTWPDYRQYFNTKEVDPRAAGVRPCNSCKVYRKYFSPPPNLCFVSACTTTLPCKRKCDLGLER